MDVRKQNIAYNVKTGFIKRKFELFHQYQQYEQPLLLVDHWTVGITRYALVEMNVGEMVMAMVSSATFNNISFLL